MRRLSVKRFSDTIRRTCVTFFGLVTEGLASVFMVRANVGAGAWTTITQGAALQANCSIGLMTTVVGLITLAFDLLLGEKIGIGTLLDTFVYGVSYDFFDKMLNIPANLSPLAGTGILLAGIVTEIIGIYICFTAALSCGPRDLFLVGLSKKMPKLSVGTVNLIINAVFIAAGALMGATVGVGTVLFCAAYTPIMDGIYKLLKFDPRSVKQESVYDTYERLKNDAGGRRKGGVRAEKKSFRTERCAESKSVRAGANCSEKFLKNT